jgi:hypothetical protein
MEINCLITDYFLGDQGTDLPEVPRLRQGAVRLAPLLLVPHQRGYVLPLLFCYNFIPYCQVLKSCRSFRQCCETVTIFFTVSIPTIDKLWFRFRLLTSFVSGSRSNTQFYIVSTFLIPFHYGSGTAINYGSGSGSGKVRN